MKISDKSNGNTLFTCAVGKYDASITGVVFKADNGDIIGKLSRGVLEYLDSNGNTQYVDDHNVKIDVS